MYVARVIIQVEIDATAGRYKPSFTVIIHELVRGLEYFELLP